MVDAEVHGQELLAVGPQQGHQVDALHHLVVLARPVPAHQLDLRPVGLVQRGVVQDEVATLKVHQVLHLLPQRLAVRGLAQQKATPAVVSTLRRRAPRRLRHRRPLRLRNQPLHVVFGREFRASHAAL